MVSTIKIQFSSQLITHTLLEVAHKSGILIRDHGLRKSM